MGALRADVLLAEIGKAANSVSYLPNSYINLNNLPFELADQFPVVQQVKDIMAAGSSAANLDSFTDLAFNSWTLWAQSATACGTHLTQDCVLKNASAHKEWTAGGLFAPVNTDPADKQPSNCVLLMRLTKSGWVYDKKATQPNSSVYNCGPDNNVTTKSYLGGS